MATAIKSRRDVTPANRPYQPFGAALKLARCRDREILLDGPAGTGKSRACLEKLYALANKYAGMRGLILRKTRKSMTESALVTFEEKVVPEDSPILLGAGGKRIQRGSRDVYNFPNGSAIVTGGMDHSTRLFSTEFDVIYVQEAIEFTEDEWEKLLRPLRNNRMPYQQVIADTNPDAPHHWLNRRCLAGKVTRFPSRHEDNPTLWDHRRSCWTPEGERYIAVLDALTGPRKDRLRWGRWVQAEGVVYEAWSPAIHLVGEEEMRAAGVIL